MAFADTRTSLLIIYNGEYMGNLEKFHQSFAKEANPAQAKNLQRFFKTAPGQYGEGDYFLGIKVPQTRSLVRRFAKELDFDDIRSILQSAHHEERLAALLILLTWFQEAEKTADQAQQKKIYQFYLQNSTRVNNWDLVDLTAPGIVGAYLLAHSAERKVLNKLIHSKNLWQPRIAMLATYPFIKVGQLSVALDVAQKLLFHPHDLMHKAVGWMLREVGKVDENVLLEFLRSHYQELPRTTLRYAIERFPEQQRKQLLLGNFT